VLVHCLAAPFAAGIEWLWLGTRLTSEQAWSSVVILAGVALALAPDRRLRLTRSALVWGIVFGVTAAFAQGLGAVVSRKAYQVAAGAGEHIDGLTAAYQRIVAGWAIAAASYVLFRKRDAVLDSVRSDADLTPQSRWERARGWVLLNALAGPTLGVGCYQWALADAPTGVVLPIVATTPIVIIPLARLIEGERPRKRSLLGGAIAVIGAVTLAGGTKLLVSWLQRSP
jgi:drug/metabolite transporter (DMT)-like permease